VTGALAVAAAACAYVASKSSSDELHGAYRDSARDMLTAASVSFARNHDPTAVDSLPELRAEVIALKRSHDELSSIAVYRPGRGERQVAVGGKRAVGTELGMAMDAMSSGRPASAEVLDDGLHAETLVTPLQDGARVVGALAVSYDLRPAHELLADRNQRVLLVLGLLLAGFTLFLLIAQRRRSLPASLVSLPA